MMRDAIVLSINPDLPGADIKYRDNSEVHLGVKMAGRAYWNLKVGDFVIVAYLGGTDDPIIIDKVLVHGDPLIEGEKPAPDDIKVLHTVENDDGEITGEVRVHTDKDGILTVEMLGTIGSINLKASGEVGDINLESIGSLNVIAPGGVTVNSEEGNVSVVAGGDIDVTAGGKVVVDGGSVELGSSATKKFVNNLPACLFTGAPHAILNTNVKV